MKPRNCTIALLFLALLSTTAIAQTNKDIQGTWRVISTSIKFPDGGEFKMDSATHNLTKTITRNRIIFTIYDRKTDSLIMTAQGKAITKGNQYTELLEQSSDRTMVGTPIVYTYKVQGNKLSYEGGTKNMHIVEVLRRIE